MLLGDILASLRDPLVAEKALASLDDLPLAASVSDEAEASGLPLGVYVAERIDHYAEGAGDEEWTTLIGLMARSADPGTVLLRRALAHRCGSCGDAS